MKDKKSKKQAVHNLIIKDVKSIFPLEAKKWAKRFGFPIVELNSWQALEVEQFLNKRGIIPDCCFVFCDKESRVKLLIVNVISHFYGSAIRVVCGTFKDDIKDYLASEKGISHDEYMAFKSPGELISFLCKDTLDSLLGYMFKRVQSLNELPHLFVPDRDKAS